MDRPSGVAHTGSRATPVSQAQLGSLRGRGQGAAPGGSEVQFSPAPLTQLCLEHMTKHDPKHEGRKTSSG